MKKNIFPFVIVAILTTIVFFLFVSYYNMKSAYNKEKVIYRVAPFQVVQKMNSDTLTDTTFVCSGHSLSENHWCVIMSAYGHEVKFRLK